MPNKLVEKRNELAAKQKKLHDVFAEAGADLDMDKVKGLDGSSADKVAAIRKMNDELAALGKEVDDLASLEGALKASQGRDADLSQPAAQAQFPAAPGASRKSIGAQFIELPAVKAFNPSARRSVAAEIDMDLKTLVSTSAGFAPETLRNGDVVPYVRRPLRILDIVPSGQTTQNAVVYMEQTTRTNAAAEATEGSGAYGESALAWTERSSNVRDIATWIPVTNQQLEDVPQVESIINSELISLLRERLDSQLLVGNGSPPNLAGVVNVSGILTYDRAGDKFDAVYEGIKKVKVTGRSNPSQVVFNPNDWQELRLLRTNDGLYILGNPSDSGPERIWGVPVVQSDALTENSVLVGDFATWCKLYERRGVLVEITESHSDYFVYGKYAIRATVRVAFVVSRPAAFCTVTSM